MNAKLCIEKTLDHFASRVGKHLEATPLAIIGPILGDMDLILRRAVESILSDDKKPKAAIILDTWGGVVELVERMVGILRHHFSEIHFLIPNKAMSVGTIFAMSGMPFGWIISPVSGRSTLKLSAMGNLCPPCRMLFNLRNW